MVEVLVDGYMPFVGRSEQTDGFSSLRSRFPEIPMSNHGLIAFIDRLFRLTGWRNWILRGACAVSRTAIPNPAE
jgi:hypothetical protein